jgi:hypothetical protein
MLSTHYCLRKVYLSYYIELGAGRAAESPCTGRGYTLELRSVAASVTAMVVSIWINRNKIDNVISAMRES